jgi:hypothetical protein
METNNRQPNWNIIEGEWRLFFNEEENTSTIKDLKSKPSKLYPGSVIMTPKGIGRYIKSEDNIAYIKLSNSDQESQFGLTEISLYFNLYLRIQMKEESQWFRLTLPANGEVSLLKKEIEILKLVTAYSYSLLYDGNIITDGYFDQLNMKNNSKVFIFGCKGKEYKLSRVSDSMYATDWYSSDQDSIIFSVSQKIRLSGIGYFVSSGNNSLKGKLKICELGDAITNTEAGRGGRRARRQVLRNCMENEVIAEVDFELQGSANSSEAIGQIMLKKPVGLKASCDYLIIVYITNPCDVWSSTYDNSSVYGEKDIIFKFKCSDVSSSSNDFEGNFPEIYYFI